LAEANSGLPPEQRISFRIGVHIGDLMVRAGDLFGDGVNIACPVADPCQTWRRVCLRRDIRSGKKGAAGYIQGSHGYSEKNIEVPIRVYEASAQNEHTGIDARQGTTLPET
jgi:adenylate cyclase